MNLSMEDKFQESINVKKKIIESDQIDHLKHIGDSAIKSIINGGKLMICGNGGSAADAQHLVAELLVRLRPTYNREGVPAITLAQDVSTITACGNDYGFEYIFERVLESLGKPGDTLLGITTSGNSKNIINAVNLAKKMDITVCAFLGAGGGPTLDLCDNAFLVPSDITGRIQEAHITAGHILMEYIEDGLLEKDYLHLKI